MNAKEMLELTNKNNFRKEAIEYAIKSLEDKMQIFASRGNRNCIVDFKSYPGGHKDFIEKHGKENESNYSKYDVEKEIREHFEGLGFKFKLITDDICGGVRQDPYWTICW